MWVCNACDVHGRLWSRHATLARCHMGPPALVHLGFVRWLQTGILHLSPCPLQWIADQSDDVAAPLYSLADVGRLVTAGHSRGGKVASLAFTSEGQQGWAGHGGLLSGSRVDRDACRSGCLRSGRRRCGASDCMLAAALLSPFLPALPIHADLSGEGPCKGCPKGAAIPRASSPPAHTPPPPFHRCARSPLRPRPSRVSDRPSGRDPLLPRVPRQPRW